MATTPKLGLTLLEGSSVVDYTQLNSWMSVIDNMGEDYVVQSGNKNYWWYRIWKSGRAECGIDNHRYFDSINISDTGLWPPLKVSSLQTSFGNYPLTFVARPHANICVNYSEPSATIMVIQKSQAGELQVPGYILANATTGQNYFTNVQLSIFCTGVATGVRQ